MTNDNDNRLNHHIIIIRTLIHNDIIVTNYYQTISGEYTLSCISILWHTLSITFVEDVLLLTLE